MQLKKQKPTRIPRHQGLVVNCFKHFGHVPDAQYHCWELFCESLFPHHVLLSKEVWYLGTSEGAWPKPQNWFKILTLFFWDFKKQIQNIWIQIWKKKNPLTLRWSSVLEHYNPATSNQSIQSNHCNPITDFRCTHFRTRIVCSKRSQGEPFCLLTVLKLLTHR